MKSKFAAILLAIACLLVLCACGGNSAPSGAGPAGAAPAQTGAGANAPAPGPDFPRGLIRISDAGDGKLVFIIDTALIDDDLSGVVQCTLNFGDYSVNYIVWGENSLNCDISHAAEENGKRVSRPVAKGEYSFVGDKLIITFDAAEAAAAGFRYTGAEGSYFQVYRDGGHRINFPFTDADLLINDDSTAQAANLANDYGIGYKPSAFDLQYFTPQTDDYIITAWDNADSMGNPTQTNALFSFDEGGNCVQYVTRVDMPVGEGAGSVDAENLAGDNGYYHDCSGCLHDFNDRTFGGKLFILSCLTKGERPESGSTNYNPYEGIREGARVYCAKPIAPEQTETKFFASAADAHLEEIGAYLNELGVGQDYQAHYTPTQTKEELVENRFLKYTDNGDEITQAYRRWPELKWEELLVAAYGADGRTEKQYQFRIFEDGAMVPYFLYYMSVLPYNWETPDAGPVRYPTVLSGSVADVEIDENYMDYVSDNWTLFGDRVLCLASTVGDELNGKAAQNLFLGASQGYGGGAAGYFSMEYLTQRQLEALDVTWQYRTFKG